MSDGLPDGWVDTQLGNLIDGFQAGRNLSSQGRPAGPGEFGVLRISAVTWGSFRPEENKALLEGDQPKAHEVVRRGDLLITRANTSDLVGAVVLVNESHPQLMLPDKILRLLAKPRVVDPRFLVHALRSAAARDHFASNATGTSESMRNLSQPKLAATPVRLPPLAEQRRIAEKIEALLERLSAARGLLDTATPLVRRFRQSVLAKAFRGELVPTEAELAARDDRPFESALAVLGTTGIEARGELPDGWGLAKFGDLLTELKNGLSPRPSIDPPGTPILRISAVRPGAVLIDDHRFLPDGDGHLATYGLRDGDLLFTRYNGSLDLVGVCGRVRGLGKRLCLYPDKLMRARLNEQVVLPDFIELYFQSPAARTLISALARSSAGQQGISGADLKAHVVPIAPIEEQRRIVAKVQTLLGFADSLEAAIEHARTALDRAPQTILQRAFAGELVTTEADIAAAEGREFESAEEMLLRVRASTTASEGTPTSTKIRGRSSATARRV